jgi:hypothetical protein
MPEWSDLIETVAAARERDARVHFDGARLWETTSHFGRPLTENGRANGGRPVGAEALTWNETRRHGADATPGEPGQNGTSQG